MKNINEVLAKSTNISTNSPAPTLQVTNEDEINGDINNEVITLTSTISNNAKTSSTSTNKGTGWKKKVDSEEEKVSPHKLNMMNQSKNLDIAMQEAENTTLSLQLQEKEIELRRQQLTLDTEERRNNSKTLNKLFDKFVDQKDSSQDVFVRLKSQLDLQRNIISKNVYKRR